MRALRIMLKASLLKLRIDKSGKVKVLKRAESEQVRSQPVGRDWRVVISPVLVIEIGAL